MTRARGERVISDCGNGETEVERHCVSSPVITLFPAFAHFYVCTRHSAHGDDSILSVSSSITVPFPPETSFLVAPRARAESTSSPSALELSCQSTLVRSLTRGLAAPVHCRNAESWQIECELFRKHRVGPSSWLEQRGTRRVA